MVLAFTNEDGCGAVLGSIAEDGAVRKNLVKLDSTHKDSTAFCTVEKCACLSFVETNKVPAGQPINGERPAGFWSWHCRNLGDRAQAWRAHTARMNISFMVRSNLATKAHCTVFIAVEAG